MRPARRLGPECGSLLDAKKDLAVAAKRAKKLRKQNVKMISADAPKKEPA